MAWKQVKVKSGKVSIDAMLKGNVLHINPDYSVGDSVNIGGSNRVVESSSLVLRGDMLEIILADASPKKEKLENGNKQAQG